MTDEAVESARRALSGLAVPDVPLGPMTTYRVGGRAALFVEIGSERDLERVCRAVSASGVPVLVVGKGSNLLVADAGFGGLAVRLGDRFATVEVEGETALAGAAAAYPVLARRTSAAGLSGMEWAVGIPGSVGGAVRMNAGGHGAETKDRLLRARVVDLFEASAEPRWRSREELEFSYRRSSIGPGELVLQASYALEPGDPTAGAARISEIVRWRRENQPGGQNAGSVFTNPPGDSAGRLIDAAGLKGMRIGSAAVSDKHANFIQADAGGSADDVRRVIEAVRQAVLERTGVELAVEVRLIGAGRVAAG
ncbi:MAG TPA: UDP-N-acetylmuramate dehydrogenase [Acidimicrobiales bacterium]|nr:UDP-N-acetylmuramate dehydrogenase [Acidimicrobiales bacterium]